MSIEYEYTDADNNSPRRIKPGEYNVKVVGYEFGLSATGKEKLVLNLHFGELDVDFKDDIYFTSAAAWRMDTVLKCFTSSLGQDLPKAGDRLIINQDFVDRCINGGTGRVRVVEGTYNGKPRTEIKAYLAGTPNLSTTEDTGAGSGQSTMLDGEEDDVDVPF